jgi:8-oxo-dGTP pyrophosphatase MutT (NUDIX family)
MTNIILPEQYSLTKALGKNKPKKVLARRWRKRSAVVALVDGDHAETASLLMIQRAKREGDPWSGHMAFPGGRAEKVDRNGLATAKREMHEEVGFDVDAAEHQHLKARVIGRLSDVATTRRSIAKKMVISPYVMMVESRPKLEPNYEVDQAVWIPLAYFSNPDNREISSFKFGDEQREFPCLRYADNQVIWGMTLRMIDEILRIQGYKIPNMVTTIR